TLFPADSTEKKNERLLRSNFFNIHRNFLTRDVDNLIDPVWDHSNSWQVPSKALEFLGLNSGRHMNRRGTLHVFPLDQLNPGRFRELAFHLDQFFDQHAPGRDQIWSSELPCGTCRRPGGPKEDGVQMNDCETGEVRPECTRQCRRPVEPT